MKRIITGWFLILLIAVFTVTANTNLRYCLCNAEIILANCPCEMSHLPSQDDMKQSTENCCESCEQHEPKNVNVSQSICKDSSCMIDFSIPLNDFVTSTSDTFHTENLAKPHSPLTQTVQDFTVPSVILARGIYATRGSPPSLSRSDVPIYIRDSVYRL